MTHIVSTETLKRLPAQTSAFLFGKKKEKKEADTWWKSEVRAIEASIKRRDFVVEYAAKKNVTIDARAWWK